MLYALYYRFYNCKHIKVTTVIIKKKYQKSENKRPDFPLDLAQETMSINASFKSVLFVLILVLKNLVPASSDAS